ncbi:protein OCTOPUS-like [Salvia splendens]|uniref:protein OCTOPUS-like n=1 Tax=Salvia splendens TaxID=180675 RepID=UPI001C2611DE|nr:protein OCTOPUS-like [Salvia splendens]
MNQPSSVDPTAPPPPQPPRSSFSCDRHPTENFTGFCPICLCERLTTLDGNSSSNTPSSVSAAMKALFSSSSSATSFFPELRRTKSFSTSNNEALSQFFEPQRKSYDVRGRNTLWSLFSLDDGGASSGQNPANGKKIGSLAAERPVFKETENDDDFRDPENVEIDEIEESHLENSRNEVEFEELDGGGFWVAASVFSKKWHKWRRKQKMKKENNPTLHYLTPFITPHLQILP